MTIIREQTRITGSKRLGGPAVTAGGATAVATPAAAAPDRNAIRASLREAFAEELEELEEDARKDGLLAAESQVKDRLRVLEDEQRLWQEKETQKGAEQNAGQTAALEAAVSAFRETAAAVSASAEASALTIAYAAVTKMLGELAGDHALLTRLVSQALKEHALTGAFTLAVSPADHARLPALPDAAALECVADEGLKAGDCVIRFANGRIDAGLEQQLSVLKNVFLESLAATHVDA